MGWKNELGKCCAVYNLFEYQLKMSLSKCFEKADLECNQTRGAVLCICQTEKKSESELSTTRTVKRD